MLKGIEARAVTATFWRQTAPSRSLLQVAEIARYEARYHTVGSPGTWYGSSTEATAWQELRRHWTSPDIAITEVRRRIGTISVTNLLVLDLTDQKILDVLDIDTDALTADDYSICQDIADQARAAGFDGLLALSAAVKGEQTLVVFTHALGKLDEVESEVTAPPA